MITPLTAAGYEQTKSKLANLEQRLGKLLRRSDVPAVRKRESQHSYEQMIAQYRRELKLYEASHPEAHAEQSNG